MSNSTHPFLQLHAYVLTPRVSIAHYSQRLFKDILSLSVQRHLVYIAYWTNKIHHLLPNELKQLEWGEWMMNQLNNQTTTLIPWPFDICYFPLTHLCTFYFEIAVDLHTNLFLFPLIYVDMIKIYPTSIPIEPQGWFLDVLNPLVEPPSSQPLWRLLSFMICA